MNSEEAITSNLLFFEPYHTQTSIVATNVYEVYPQTSIDYSDVLTFLIKAHPKQMIQNIEIVTKIRVLTAAGGNPAKDTNVSTVSNFASAIWRTVDVVIGGENLMQSFDNAYNIGHFFDTVLNSDANRADILFSRELFVMEDVVSKGRSENTVFYPEEGTDVVNRAARKRADRVKGGRETIVISDLNCSLFRTGKLLPANLDIRVALTKNYSGYALLEAAEGTHKIKYDQCYLRVTTQQPTDFCLHLIEMKLKTQPAVYQAEQGVLSYFSLTSGGKTDTINNLFPQGRLPVFFVLAVSTRDCFGDSRAKNPFTFIAVEKIQVYVNGVAYFPSELLGQKMHFDHLYQACGYKTAGCSLISENSFDAYRIVPIDLTADRSSNRHHLNLSRSGDVKVNLQTYQDLPEGALLLVYAYYDRIIEIDSDRNIRIK